jgi:hypothetical protein
MDYKFLLGFDAEELIQRQIKLNANALVVALEQLARLRPESAIRERHPAQAVTNDELARLIDSDDATDRSRYRRRADRTPCDFLVCGFLALDMRALNEQSSRTRRRRAQTLNICDCNYFDRVSCYYYAVELCKPIPDDGH